MEQTPLDQAILKAGSVRKLAGMIGVSRFKIYRWRDSQVPAEYCRAIESATGVPREQLRPDLFA